MAETDSEQILNITSIRPESEQMFHLRCSATADVRAAYIRPGQYAQLYGGAKAGYYALASAPDDSYLEFLIKNEGEPSTQICAMRVGDELRAGPISGAGFVLPEQLQARAAQLHWHLFSMGSGIGPMRALIRFFLGGHLECAGITLWQCSFERSHVPFLSELRAWEAGGVRVHLCLDRPGQDFTGNLAENVARENPDMRSAVGCWIGSPAFGDSVRQITAQTGLAAGNLITNFG
ncbi:MAG: hypothetical protein KDK34_03860 [Leptospiraceae bacterium]|nr:hypothetical protein [Leptospiraceae bacterium]